jgi:hypothetical protein
MRNTGHSTYHAVTNTGITERNDTSNAMLMLLPRFHPLVRSGVRVVSDVNGDGEPDIVSADNVRNTIRIQDDAGNEFVRFSIGESTAGILIDDVNHDGYADVVVLRKDGYVAAPAWTGWVLDLTLSAPDSRQY